MDGPDYVLVASNGASTTRPAGTSTRARSRRWRSRWASRSSLERLGSLDQGDGDYERLWKLANDNNHARYDAYQKMTSRPIPLVVVSPS